VQGEQSLVGIYFVQDQDGPIKIGHAADPVARLRGLQNGNPRELTILGWFEAPAEVEGQLHGRLLAHRIRGEWFENCGEVLDALAYCLEKYGSPACPVCERETRYIMAGHEAPEPDGRHRCGRPW
jgi:hypothetical protein